MVDSLRFWRHRRRRYQIQGPTGSEWRPPVRVYLEDVRGRVTVDEQFRVLINDCWVVSPVFLEEYWHLFRDQIGEEKWLAVVEANRLPRKMRQTLRSTGLRKGQGRLIGRYPKRSIVDIQVSRHCEPGEPSFRTPSFREVEQRVKADIASGAIDISEGCGPMDHAFDDLDDNADDDIPF